jgi:cytidine deaminase
MNFEQLKQIASQKVKPRQLSGDCHVASVASALLTDKGNVYTGVCIDTACSMGFCAEHSAIAQMVANEESKIIKIVAMGKGETIYPPCGRCREFIYQINNENLEADILVGENTVVKLKDLLPHRWEEAKGDGGVK